MNSKRKQGGATKTHNNRTMNTTGSRKGALISAAATIGLLTSQGGEYYEGPSFYAQALKVDVTMRERDVVGTDDIGKSSADDMFAFSQIVAAGGNPMEVAAQLEKEAAAKKQEEKKIGGLSEDQAMAAFAEFAAGDGTDPTAKDPKQIQAEKEAAAKAAKARSELSELATNDATSAFASLVESQVTEQKASTYEGSGTQADQEAAVSKGLAAAVPQAPDALAAVQKQSEAELTEANKQVERTDCAQEAAARLGTDGNVQTAEDNATAPAEAGEAAAGKAVKEAAEKAAKPKPASKPKIAPIKKAAPTAKPKPAPKAPSPPPVAAAAPAATLPEGPTIDLAASLAASDAPAATETQSAEQVDKQADEILDQIRSASVGIKGLGGNGGGEGVDPSALEAAMQGMNMNLVQLDSDIRDHDLPDENAQIAMEYLAQQFPDEYPRDTVKPAPAKGPTAEEKEVSEKQALLDYAKRVTEEATESRDQVLTDIAEKEERRKLARMGMEGEPVTLQLSSENLLQLGDSVRFDEDALEAQSYLESQFPDEFPKDFVKDNGPTGPSQEELEKQKQKEFLKFAEKVTEAATESRDQVVQELHDKKEKEELSHMGVAPDNRKPVDWKAIEAKKHEPALVQLGSHIQTRTADGLRGANLVQLSEDIVLDEQEAAEQSNIKSQDSSTGQVSLAQVAQKSGEQLVSSSAAAEKAVIEESLEEGVEQEAVPQPALANTAQNDLSGMSADDMRSYSESVAQAADVVNSESENDKAKEAEQKGKGSLAQVKGDKQGSQTQSIKGSGQNGQKEEQQPTDQDAKALDMKNPDLEAKAALVAQAEAANQAAIEDPSQPAVLAKGGQQAKEVSLEELDADQKKEQLKQVAAAKYAQDKKTALDQGYTEQQAELYAQQEAYASPNTVQGQAAPATQTPETSQPTNGAPTGSPPTIPGRDQAGASKEAATPADPTAELQAAALATPAATPSAAQTAEDSSIEQQIKQAQEQQALIKAQIEKKKQEKQNLLAMNSIAANEAAAQGQAPANKAAKPTAVIQQQQVTEAQPIAQPAAPMEAPQKQPESTPSTQPVDQQPQAENQQQALAQALTEQMQTNTQAQEAAQPQMEPQATQASADATNQQMQAEMKAQEIANQMIQQQQLNDASVNQEVANQLNAQNQQAVDQKQQETAEEAARSKKDDKKTHKLEKSTLQQSEEIHRHTPKEVKKQLKSLKQGGRSRAQQYEEDLNKARDEIQKAQSEMKNIDSEVADFHSKMAKSMHSLLKAFTEGFEAMDKAKSDELDNELVKKAEKKRASKFDKLNLGISNLEALTSKLKMSFGDENKDQQPASNEAIQSNADIHQNTASIKTQAIQENQQNNQKNSNSQQKQVNQQKVSTPSPNVQPVHKQTIINSQKVTLQNKPIKQVTKNDKQTIGPIQGKGEVQKPTQVKPQTVNVNKKIQAQKIASPVTKQVPQQVAQPKTAKKSPQVLSQQKSVAKVSQQQQPTHQLPQTKKVAIKTKPPTPQVKSIKLQKKVQNAPHVVSNKPGQQPAQILATSKMQSPKKVSIASSKTAVKTSVKPLVVKPIKMKGVSAAQMKVKVAKPQAKKVVLQKSPTAKTGLKLIQLKKKPVLKPIKVISKQKQPILHKSAVGLAQLSESTSDIENNHLLSTNEQVPLKSNEHHRIQPQDLLQKDTQHNSDQMISHTISDRILMQLDSGKSQEEIIADLAKTKEAWQVAKKAYYEKDPEAIQLIQLADSTDVNTLSQPESEN